MLLRGAGEEAGHVDERYERDVEGVAKAHEPRGLHRCVDVEDAREDHRLLRDDADGATVKAREGADDVLRPALVHLEHILIVDDVADDLFHVVGLVRGIGDDSVQGRLLAIGRVVGRDDRGRVEIVRWQEPDEAAEQRRAAHLVIRLEMRDARAMRVHVGAPQLVERHVLVRHGLHHVGTGDEHVARIADHHNEVGDRGRVDRAARARAHDRGDLRDDARGQHVPEKDVGVTAERNHALLDPCATGIVQSNDRRAGLHGEVHHLADLLGVRLGERTSEDREVLGEDVHESPVDPPEPGDDAVAHHALVIRDELRRTRQDECVELTQGALVEHQIDPLARRQLPLRVLLSDPLLAAADGGFRPHL